MTDEEKKLMALDILLDTYPELPEDTEFGSVVLTAFFHNQKGKLDKATVSFE